LERISAKLNPIRLHFDKGYKVKYPEYARESNTNPEESRDYFKLPNISRDFR
jgi:hypothetical protein